MVLGVGYSVLGVALPYTYTLRRSFFLTPQESIRALAEHVKSAVLPHLGTWRSRKITGYAASGDTTFSIDDIAEEAVESFIHDHALNVAYYSEDRGLIYPFPDKTPEGILIIDPIDGTRGAVAGLESCVVSVAWADFTPEPTVKDVRYAGITEIKGNLTFSAERGKGVVILNEQNQIITPAPLPTDTIPQTAWSAGLVGSPVDLIFQAIPNFVNQTTVRGGFFVLNSSAFELTRLVTGQLSAVVDIRTRVLRDFPQTRPAFLQCGGGHCHSLYGYDVAAAILIAQEAGCIVTDAWGRDQSDWNLLDTTEGNFGSLIAASNPTLHAKILEMINTDLAGFKV